MSSRRNARATKTETTAQTEAVAVETSAQTVDATQPATTQAADAQPVAQVVQDTAQPATEQADDKEHQMKMNEKLGLNITLARSRCHIDALNMNKANSAVAAPLSQRLLAFETAKAALKTGKVKEGAAESDLTEEQRKKFEEVVASFASEEADVRSKLNALSGEKVRYSVGSLVVLATTLDEVAKQLYTHACNRALIHDRARVNVEYVGQEGFDRFPLSPLVRGLPSFVNPPKFADARAKKVVAEVTADAAQAAATPAEAPVEAEQADDDEHASADKKTFTYYLKQIGKHVTSKTPEFNKLSISRHMHVYINTLLTELVSRIAPLVQMFIDATGIKTVNEHVIMYVVKSLLVDNCSYTDSITFEKMEVTDQSAVDVERAKPKEQRAALSSLPKVDVVVAKKTTVFQGDRFSDLRTVIDSKLAQYKELTKKAAKTEVASE